MKKYFLHNGTNNLGPLSIEDLKLHGISKEDMVWFEGITDWEKAGKLEELNQLFISTPPPIKYHAIPNQEQFAKVSLHDINIETIRKSPQQLSDITALLIAVEEEYALRFLYNVLGLDSSKEGKPYIEKIKKEKLFETIKSGKAKYLDEIIAYLCISDQRSKAIAVYSGISKESELQSSLYVNNLVEKYGLDMSIEEKEEKFRKMFEATAKRREEREKLQEQQSKEYQEKIKYSQMIGILGLVVSLVLYFIGKFDFGNMSTDEAKFYEKIMIGCLVMIAFSIVHSLLVKKAE